MIDQKASCLVAINEAITALDYALCGSDELETDADVQEAMSILLKARLVYTEKQWPEQEHLGLKRDAFEQWFADRADEQRKAGIL